MKGILVCILSAFIALPSFCQNVGENGKNDSIINYTDIQGNKQGKWTKNYKSGKKAYVATFRNNKLVGEYTRYFSTGELMAHVKYNETGDVGYAKLYYDNKSVCAEGKYVNQNVRDSIWRFYGTDGFLMSEVSYKKGVLDGPSKSYFRNGQVYELITYKDSVKEGLWRRFYESGGTEMETVHVKGLRHGGFQVFYPEGQLKIKGKYWKDIQVGKWIYYNKGGSVDKELEFVNGRLKNQDEVDAEFTKQVKEWDKLKGTIPEPSDKQFYKNGPE